MLQAPITKWWVHAEGGSDRPAEGYSCSPRVPTGVAASVAAAVALV